MKRLLLLALLIPVLVFAAGGDVVKNQPSPVYSSWGRNPITAKITVTDTSALVKTLFDSAYGGTDPNWAKVQAIYMTCEDNAVRVSPGTAAGQGASRMGHKISAGDSYSLAGDNDTINVLYIINETNGAAGVCMVTVGF